MTEVDTAYRPELLKKAFELAEKGRGRTYPNPLVGAVIVNDGIVVGEGWHERLGGPHAEVVALEAAGDRARGAEIYVSLEPCCHFGRTPPCAAALIEAGVSRIIIGAIDRNPLMAGRGIDMLRREGLRVIIAGVPRDYERQNEVYVKYITRREPFVTLKSAISINGKISAAAGIRTKLTGKAVQAEVHTLRNELPLVAVGVGTAAVDDPLLTCRLDRDDVRQPIRLVIDSHGRLPLTCRLIKTIERSPVWLAATNQLEAGKRRELERAGVEILLCEPDLNGRVDLRDLLKQLGEREMAGMMVEGGARLNDSFIRGGLVDKLVVFVAPIFLGGAAAVPMTADGEKFARNYEITSSRMIDGDLMIEAYPAGEEKCFQES